MNQSSDKIPGIFFNGHARYGRKQIGKMDKQILINLCQNHAGIAEVEIIF
jgi:hypothetical protein